MPILGVGGFGGSNESPLDRMCLTVPVFRINSADCVRTTTPPPPNPEDRPVKGAFLAYRGILGPVKALSMPSPAELFFYKLARFLWEEHVTISLLCEHIRFVGLRITIIIIN